RDGARLDRRGVAAHGHLRDLDVLQLNDLGLEARERDREQGPLDEAVRHGVDLLGDAREVREQGEVDGVEGLVRAVRRLGAHDASHDSPWSSMMSRSLARQRPRVEPMLPTGMPMAAEMAL